MLLDCVAAAAVEMEDAHSVQLPLCPSDASSAYFAVFDGHGGTHFSTHCGKELHKVLVENCHFGNGESPRG